jgi:hypothetical protein
MITTTETSLVKPLILEACDIVTGRILLNFFASIDIDLILS